MDLINLLVDLYVTLEITFSNRIEWKSEYNKPNSNWFFLNIVPSEQLTIIEVPTVMIEI